MYVADFLSRFFVNDSVQSSTVADIDGLIHSINVSPDRELQIRDETKMDHVLRTLKEVLMQGWPTNKKKLPEEVKSFWKFKNSLILSDGLIFFEERLFIPVSMRKEVLSQLHSAHFGMSKTKARAREIVYWPGLSRDIEDMIERCSICQRFSSNQKRDTLKPYEIPELAFGKVGMDVGTHEGKDILVIIDYYSKYIEAIPLVRKTDGAMFKKLEVVFSIYGIPKMIFADNMPFQSFEFKRLAKELDIVVTTSSPLYPKSNGLSEKAVQIVKRMLIKSGFNGLWLSLLEYRNTPLSDLEISPTQLIFGKKTRSILPEPKSQFNVKVVPNLNNNFKRKVDRNVKYYNRGTKKEDCFETGEKIFVERGKIWVDAEVIKKDSAPRSYWIRILKDDQVLRRNIFHLKKNKCLD